MALNVGTCLGHYNVTSLLGEGGMGQVWQATDTQLNRQVALKILPDAFAADPDRLARFQREAQILASLNHPNIAAIHGVEEAEGTRALVLELVEGPTLADRISKGAIPLDEALPIAKQIAEALEAAHEAGVIHRDLKPANIKVREDGTVKVLDFGLAKAFQPGASDASESMSPTISLTAAATQMGMVIGTAAYMAPEQAKGKVVDKRADIWAFGAVLFDMLSGTRAFGGDDVSDTMASVLKSEPDYEVLPPDIHPGLCDVLRRCLAKDRKERYRDIGDVQLDLKEEPEDSRSRTIATHVAGDTRPTTLMWSLVGVLAVAVVVLGVGLLRTLVGSGAPEVVRSSLTLSPGERLTAPGLAVSPDGRTLAFSRRAGGGQSEICLRDLDVWLIRCLPGTERGTMPFF